ncbi:ligase-associated DNA damage response endonuclease PdeM [uncultured Tateyamaria sp.]|uniref:ligase-associated DNA damage response endonuclease PdeM n=1 Tax=uncultured Tateyamaria sp. TaxID=455651 RepID=UPI0026355C4C|nr:ligase-associated DNA damage response endonuclease PdeM [uncultured Tateyamaria sp.]
MNTCDLTLAGTALKALGSGALFWPDQALLCVSDLHLGKAERIARRGGGHLPPYETRDTLTRLANDLEQTGARTVICLGDSFDDLTAARSLPEDERLWITRLQAGRRWIWIEGNHDPGPVEFGGSHLGELSQGPLTFRHIAEAGTHGEISGHYHPKATLATRGRAITRPAFLIDNDRLIMPAYGTYTGGLRSHDATLTTLMRSDAQAVLTGAHPVRVPMPR